MQVNQASSVLTILGIAQKSDVSQLQVEEKSAFEIKDGQVGKSTGAQQAGRPSNRQPEPWEERANSAEYKAIQERKEKLQNGEIHPLGDDKSIHYAEAAEGRDPRFLREGGFVGAYSALGGGAFPVRDAVMGDRQGALINAYHYGTDLMKANQLLEGLGAGLAARNAEMSRLKEQLASGEGDSDFNRKKLAFMENHSGGYGQMIYDDKRKADIAMASLARMFSQTDNGLEGSGTALPKFKGFEINHGTYGKLMEVSEDGSTTMFDSEGKAYTREEFVEQTPDGMIGEMHNDLIREEDERQRKAAFHERIAKILSGEIEGRVLEIGPYTYL